MRISREGLELIKHFEGLRLKAYLDPVGVWTIGWGHTGPAARPGNRIDEAEAERLLDEDLDGHASFVSRAVEVPLDDAQFSALVAFAFNLGNGAVAGSTLLKKLNGGDHAGAAREFERWVYGTIDGRKVKLAGLVRRRKSERHLFETGSFVSFERALMVTTGDDVAGAGAGAPAAASRAGNAAPAAANGFDARAFAELFSSWGIRHFGPEEMLRMGAQHMNPKSRAYGLNTYPPRERWENIRDTVRVLDELRTRYAAPILTLSVYRSPAYNKAIGGAKKSRHVAFEAIDFVVQSNTGPAEWAATLRQMRAQGLFRGGIGTYDTFVHVDTRGTNADWP